MDEKVVISVIIPAHNAEKTILRAIRSVQKQGTDSYEIVVVDDKSVDETYSIVKAEADIDNRIVVICNSDQGG